MVAALIAFSGRGELLLRSAGLLLIAVWLALDLWAWLLDKAPGWKWLIIVGTTATNLMLIAVMGIMWWWLDGKLADDREAAATNMSISLAQPAITNDPLSSVITVANGSNLNIWQRQSFCWIDELTTADHIDFFQSPSQFIVAPGTSLIKAGDAGSDMCVFNQMMDTKIMGGITCVDMRIEIIYALDNQPLLNQRKESRFVTRQEPGGFKWYRQALSQPTAFCKELR